MCVSSSWWFYNLKNKHHRSPWTWAPSSRVKFTPFSVTLKTSQACPPFRAHRGTVQDPKQQISTMGWYSDGYLMIVVMVMVTWWLWFVVGWGNDSYLMAIWWLWWWLVDGYGDGWLIANDDKWCWTITGGNRSHHGRNQVIPASCRLLIPTHGE